MRALLALAALVLAGGAAAQDAAPEPVDAVVVHKAQRRLELIRGGAVVRVIDHLQLGGDPVGPKHFEGDRRTPEGRYTIDWGNEGSAYHLSLHISYPSTADSAFAAARGRSPGGMIMLHGQPNDWAGPGRVPGDWTDGCIALADAEIEELWQVVPDGTPITIMP